MGQKVNPIVMRLSVNKDWSSKWYAKGSEFANSVPFAYHLELQSLLTLNLITIGFTFCPIIYVPQFLLKE